MKKILLTIALISLSFFLGTRISQAQNDQCSNPSSLNPPQLQSCIDQLNQALNLSLNATAPLQSELNSLQTQIQGIKDRVAAIESDLADKKAKIDKGYEDLAKQKDTLNKTIANYYIKSYYDSPFIVFLANPSSAVSVIQNLAFQRALANQDREKIVNFALLLIDLETQKKDLETEESQLTTLKASLDDQSAKLDKIVSGAKAYQASLSSQIAQLTAVQQQVLGQRLGALGIPLYASMGKGCSSDIGKPANFSGGFGAFTYGVPNRVGLNQFGALGRAQAGENYDTILHAYYNFDGYQTFSGIQINVQGYHGYDLEDYVKRIYEVPNSWGDQGGMEALKAQAIAVRSYALAYTNNGQGSICTTQDCQVFQDADKGGNWDTAVDATKGQVMVQGGQPIKAWFSSTHGGYIHSSGDIGWSSTSWTKNAQDATGSINSFADLNNNAYDKNSPWFYCDWGSRASQNNTAWLQNSEMADIVNVVLLAQKDSSLGCFLFQLDQAPPPPNSSQGCPQTGNWDPSRVRSELQSRGITPYNSISSISMGVDFNSGKTTSVTVSGDAGTQTISGGTFKSYFNLRAPANIQIVGPLYNIETEH